MNAVDRFFSVPRRRMYYWDVVFSRTRESIPARLGANAIDPTCL